MRMRFPTLTTMRRRSDGLPVLLALVLLFQSGIPIQSHTAIAHDGHGQVVVVCTLYGPVDSALDLPQVPVPTERKSPACVFSQLLASADLSVPTCLLAPTRSLVVGVDATVESPHAAHPERPYLIRAPPKGSLFT